MKRKDISRKAIKLRKKIAKLLPPHLTHKEAAAILNINPKTLEYHLSLIGK